MGDGGRGAYHNAFFSFKVHSYNRPFPFCPLLQTTFRASQLNIGLKILDISWNGFCGDSCKVLGSALKENGTLRELDLSYNRLDAEAVGGLMKGVQVNEILSTLKVREGRGRGERQREREREKGERERVQQTGR